MLDVNYISDFNIYKLMIYSRILDFLNDGQDCLQQLILVYSYHQKGYTKSLATHFYLTYENT